MRVVPILLTCFINILVAAFNLNEHPNWHLLDHERCGDTSSDRIIGGVEAELGQFPWMARLGYLKKNPNGKTVVFKCGGSLINDLYVLTAAHCVTELKGDHVVAVRLGEHNTTSPVDCANDVCAPPVQDFRPEAIYYHNLYQNPKMRNDIALIRLQQKVTFNRWVAPICLPQDHLLTKSYLGSALEVAGWGITDVQTSSPSPVLEYVHIHVIDSKYCSKVLGKYATVGDGQLCAGGQVGYDSCGGDSGGPLMKAEAVEGPPRYFLIGVVSFGSVKCGSEAPAIYTNVSYYMEWILDNIEP